MEVTQILKSNYSDSDKKVMDYFRVIADLMRLRDYDFVLLKQEEEADDESIKYASMRCQPGAKVGGLYYHPSLLDLPAEMIRLILCHEAAHALTDRIQLTAQIHAKIPAFHNQLHTELEYIVDDISKIIAPNLPLPDFKESDGWTSINRVSEDLQSIKVSNVLDIDCLKPIVIQLGSGNSIYEWPATIKSVSIFDNCFTLNSKLPETPHIGAIVSNITYEDLNKQNEKFKYDLNS